MLAFLPALLRGFVSLALHTINILLWPLLLFTLALLKLIPIAPWQQWCARAMHFIPDVWQDINTVIQRMMTKTVWDVQGLENLRRDDWYLLICNHQSWADILVLERVFHRKIPMIKFFMKKQLLWLLPGASWACWVLDFPFMERHSKEYLAKHPERKGKDIATTRKACEKFKYIPTTVMMFPEGTRFTEEKQQDQQSPYQYLLRPKAGGLAFTLATMGEYLHKVINVTIVYPADATNIWSFFSGKMAKIIVRIETVPITPDLLCDYENERVCRVYFQNWINQLWQQKDNLIKELKS